MKLQNKCIVGLQVLAICMILSCIIYRIAVNEQYQFYSQKATDYLRYDTVDVRKVGAKIDSKVDMLLGVYHSEKGLEKNTRMDSYVVPVKRDDRFYFVSISHEIGAEEEDTYMKLFLETYSYLTGESTSYGNNRFHITGVTKELDQEHYQAMQQYCLQAGLVTSQKEMDEYVVPISIEPKEVKNYANLNLLLLLFCVPWAFCLAITHNLLYAKMKPYEKKKIRLNDRKIHVLRIETINELIKKCEFDKAVKKLMTLTKCDEEYATILMENWYELYQPLLKNDED